MKSPNLKYNKAIVSLKLRKAPGVDTVQAEHLKYGGNKVAVYLSRLSKGIIKVGKFPNEWKRYKLTYIQRRQ